MEKPLQDQGLIEDFPQQKLTLKLRCNKLTKDLAIQVETSEKVGDMKQRFVSEAGIECGTIKIFYNGKQLIDDHLIGNYGLADESIISIFALG